MRTVFKDSDLENTRKNFLTLRALFPSLKAEGVFRCGFFSVTLLSFFASFAFAQVTPKKHQDSSSASPPLIRLSTYDLPPFQTVVSGTILGIMISRITCALDRLGRPYEIVFTEKEKARAMLRHEKVSGFFPASSKKKINPRTISSKPLATQELTWFFRKEGKMNLRGPEDMLLGKYGAVFGSSEWAYLKRAGYSIIKRPRNAEVLLRMLLNGDIDAALSYKRIFLYQIEASSLSEKDFHLVHQGQNDLSVHFSENFLIEQPVGFLRNFNAALLSCAQEAKL